MSAAEWQLPTSDDYIIRDTPGAGRGVFASKDLTEGTHILTTTLSLSPTAHVILRPYRREVCAYCFRYDRGQEWKVRLPNTALSFCCEECKGSWSNFYGEDALAAHQVVEKAAQRNFKQQEDADMSEESYTEDAARVKWEEAAAIGAELLSARSASKPTKTQKRLVRQHSEASIEPDIFSYLLSTTVTPLAAAATSALLALAPNPDVYKSASLDEHIRAYLQLAALLPLPKPSSLSPSLCHEYVSRASHNAFSIRPTADGDHSGEFLGYGVWPEASFFNHSCEPNLKKVREGRMWSFSLAKDVKEGEELCITYLGGEEKELGVEERRKRLSEEWEFQCACENCVAESSGG